MAQLVTQKLFRQYESPFYSWQYPTSARPLVDGWQVNNSSELLEAIADAYAGSVPITLYLTPNEYAEVSNMVAGKDFTGKKLKIRSLNTSDRALITGSPQSTTLTQHVEFSDLDFYLGNVTAGTWHFADAGSTGSNGYARNITLNNLTFNGLEKDLYAPPAIDYRDGLCDGVRFTNSYSHGNVLTNLKFNFVQRALEIRPNGSLLVNGIEINHAYYDHIRLLGQGTEGYVAGRKYIINVTINRGIGSYEEINDGEPHLDVLQMFSSGGTNPVIRDLLVGRFIVNHGDTRGSAIQCVLVQVPMRNVLFLESLLITKGAPHGAYLEGGGAFGFERCSFGDQQWVSAAGTRLFKMDGEVVYKQCSILSPILVGTAGNANLAGYELRTIDNHIAAANAPGNQGPEKHAAFYAGPGSPDGVEAVLSSFAPLSFTGIGALTAEGEWNAQAHMPTQAAAPEITGGAGQFTIDEIKEPLLGTHEVSGWGNDTEYTYNVRWCVENTYTWTTVENVKGPQSVGSEIDLIEGVTAGNIWVQTQCVNSSAPGFWSEIKQVTVS